MNLKVFAFALTLVCFTVSIAGAYIGVYYLPQLLTDDPAVPEAVSVMGSEVQMPQTQPSQQQPTNPPTQTTPLPTPQEKTVTMHVYEFCIGTTSESEKLINQFKQMGNYYAHSESPMHHVALTGVPDWFLTIGFYKQATDEQYTLMEKTQCPFLMIKYHTVEVPQSTVNAYEQAKWNIEQGIDNWLPQNGIK